MVYACLLLAAGGALTCSLQSGVCQAAACSTAPAVTSCQAAVSSWSCSTHCSAATERINPLMPAACSGQSAADNAPQLYTALTTDSRNF